MVPINEAPFKVATAILVLMFAGIRLYFQSRPGRDKEKIIIVHERRERVLVALVFLGEIPFLLYPLTPWIDPYHLPLPDWLRWFGGVTTLAGVALFLWSHRTLGKNWSLALEIHEEQTLVTDGPYRYVRHPMYAAIFLFATGLSLLSANWVLAVAFLLPFTVSYLIRVAPEEEMMIEHFGDTYRRYMKKTGRLIPWVRILGRLQDHPDTV